MKSKLQISKSHVYDYLMVDGDLLVAAGLNVHPRSAVRGEELAQVVDEDVH